MHLKVPIYYYYIYTYDVYTEYNTFVPGHENQNAVQSELRVFLHLGFAHFYCAIDFITLTKK